MKELTLSPTNQTLASLMANGKSYHVPQFQRDYTWKAEHLDELWQDIETMREEQAQHFMGYVVLEGHEIQKFQIIDGQQRLTTITLIIIAVLNRLQQLIDCGQEAEANQRRQEHYRNIYLSVFDAATLQRSQKLTLNRNNNAHLRNIIDEPYDVPKRRVLAETNRRLNKALLFFQDKLKAMNGEDLADLVKVLDQGLLFTTITVENDFDAYLIFEILNSRGVHLSASDLLKNYLLSVLADKYDRGHESFSSFDDGWSDIINQLGEKNFTAFQRSHQGMRHPLPAKKDLYRLLKKQIDAPESVMQYVQDMSRYAPLYNALQSPDDSFWEEYGKQYKHCREYVRALDLFKIKTPLSLLMAGYFQLEPKAYIQLMRWIVALSIRYNVICGKLANRQEPIYNQLAMNIMAGECSLDDIKGKLLTIYPADDEFFSAFATKSMPGSRQHSAKIKYLLSQIEQHCNDGNVSVTGRTLEHVLPNTPAEEWQEYFGVGAYEDAIDRLGNMALLTESANLGQEPFSRKRRVLQASGSVINQHIAGYEDWDMEAVNDHQRWLAEQAKHVWRIE